MFLSAVRNSLVSTAARSSSLKRVFLNSSLSKNATKAFSNVVTAKQRSNSNPTKELIKSLETELSEQIETITEEEMNPSAVLESFSEFIEAGAWKIDHPKDSLMVTLRRRDEKLQADIAVKFDLVQVYNELYDNSESELYDQEEGEIEASESERGYKNDRISESNESVDEIDEFDYASLPLSVVITRDSVPGKQLNFECILEGDEEQSDLLIENVSIEPIKSSSTATSTSTYTAPNFSQLDETLQDNFKDFLVNLIGGNQDELMAFMKEYAVAQEAGMYQNWLGEVRDILKQ